MNWQNVDWITPAIHVYAFVVLLLTLAVYFVHRHRLKDLGGRLSNIYQQIEGRGPQLRAVRLDEMTSLILHLSDVVERRSDVDIGPILAFVRHEESQRHLRVSGTLVNLTETMIELFPMLGIFGTVWGISGVGKEDFSSERLLFLFATATTTTLWALLYVIVFRITYSAFVQGKVVALQEYNRRFQDFLTILEKRSDAADFGDEAATNPWSGKSP